jgi:hypothetical protein
MRRASRQAAVATVARTVRGLSRPTFAPVCHRQVTRGGTPQLLPYAGPLIGARRQPVACRLGSAANPARALRVGGFARRPARTHCEQGTRYRLNPPAPVVKGCRGQGPGTSRASLKWRDAVAVCEQGVRVLEEGAPPAEASGANAPGAGDHAPPLRLGCRWERRRHFHAAAFAGSSWTPSSGQ